VLRSSLLLLLLFLPSLTLTSGFGCRDQPTRSVRGS
jgi:hypothetical protein